MDIIIGKRLTGKTTALIERSAATGYYIVARDQGHVHRIFNMARKMGYEIPLPITFNEFLGHQYYGRGIRGFLIDDADELLRHITGVPIYAATITSELNILATMEDIKE